MAVFPQYIFTPHACARVNVIGLSVCRCTQKIRIFRDLQVQATCEWHKTVKIGKKLTYIVHTCFSQPASMTNHDFYTPHLFTTPTPRLISYALWLRMPKFYYYRYGSSSHKLHSTELRAQQCTWLDQSSSMQLHAHSVHGVCALESYCSKHCRPPGSTLQIRIKVKLKLILSISLKIPMIIAAHTQKHVV